MIKYNQIKKNTKYNKYKRNNNLTRWTIWAYSEKETSKRQKETRKKHPQKFRPRLERQLFYCSKKVFPL